MAAESGGTPLDAREHEVPPSASPLGAPRGLGLGSLLERFGAVLVIVVLVVVYSLLLPRSFPTYENLTTILTTQDVLALLAIGALVPLAAGEFDLSVGFNLGLTGMIVAVLTTHWGVDPLPAMLFAVGVATAIGVINGLLVVRLRISAFIATLGMGSVLSGITLFLSGGTVVYQGMPESYIALGRTQIAGFPLPVFYMFAAILIATYVMGHTPFGRYTYALGGGREAARLAGLNTGRLLVGAFAVAGFMAGLAGVVATAAIGAAHPDIGSQYLLPVFAACFLGATTIQPGRFNVVGTIVALFLLAVGISGLQQMGAPLWVGPIFNGLALITAVGLAVARGSRQSR